MGNFLSVLEYEIMVGMNLREECVCAPELNSDHTFVSLSFSVFSFCPSRLNSELIWLYWHALQLQMHLEPQGLSAQVDFLIRTTQVDRD